MSDIILEIGTEEMPARFMPDIMKQMKEKAMFLLAEYRISYERCRVLGTPRRMALLVESCAKEQKDLIKKVKGPSWSIAFAEDGTPSNAAYGFAKSQGVEVSHLIREDIDGVSYVFASIRKAGRATEVVIPDLLEQLVSELSFPKNMLWGEGKYRFVRPVRWVVALLDQNIIPCQVAGIHADRITRGHRFLSQGDIRIKSAEDYIKTLEQEYVIVDIDKRRRMIVKEIEETASEYAGYIQPDENLLEELLWLVEYPTAFCGTFHSDYLGLPNEAIITPMKEHQRYFPVVDMQNNLKPMFIGLRNGTDKKINWVIKGNEKVLVARLEDAKFFYQEDLKIPFSDMGSKLSNTVFQERLGTYQEKVDRIIQIAGYLATMLGLEKEKIIECARICKNDLNSNMVNEFPELQGIMGEYYALASGLDAEVAKGIREHYMPRFQGDTLPVTNAGMIVAIADKLDSIIGIMGVGLIPTGSQDPYALRRAAQGIIQIVIRHRLQFDARKLVQYVVSLYGDKISFDDDSTVEEFFQMRMKRILQDQGIAYDQIEAVIKISSMNFFVAVLRAQAIEKFSRNEKYKSLLEGIKRANNLSQKAGDVSFDPALLQEEAEIKLAASLRQMESKIKEQKAEHHYFESLNMVLSLKDDIDEFLETTMVMVEDDALRNNRLALLARIAALTADIADFSCIVEKESLPTN